MSLPTPETLIHLAIPYTHGICVGTMKASYAQPVNYDRSRGVVVDTMSNTVAGHCFNELLVRCLSGQDLPPGRQFDYWCMVHSDVEPFLCCRNCSGMGCDNCNGRGGMPYWLDAMIDELEASKADVIHAVCCIKDDRGITSTGVGNLDDEWDATRKLTLEEVHRLPETFDLCDVLKLWETDEDIRGRPGWTFPSKRVFLAPNTGCMLWKRGDWWDDFPGFEQRSKIVRWTDPTGTVRRRASMSPEDWSLGRWCAQHDLRVVGTRKVSTAHFGNHPWSTAASWGKHKRDELYLKTIQEAKDEHARWCAAGRIDPATSVTG